MKSSEQKVKLLILYKILMSQTDEDHPMSTPVLLKKLYETGISSTRQSLYNDIKVLNHFGFEVLCDKRKSNHYFVSNREFEVPELRILLDAVHAASFITKKKTDVLIEKIAALAGEKRASILKDSVAYDYTIKHSNEKIYYNVDALDRALFLQKKVSFFYFDYGPKGSKVFRKEKRRYEVNPLGLAISNNNYYLICFSDKYRNIANYRVDRMEDIFVSEETITFEEKFKNFDLRKYMQESFLMFAGQKQKVRLYIEKNLVEAVMDKFGEELQFYQEGQGYIVEQDIIVSKQFFGWLSGFEGNIKILSPNELKNDYYNFLANNLKKVM